MRGKLLTALLGSATLAAPAIAAAANVELSDADREAGENSINDLVERAHAEGVSEGTKAGAEAERARYAAVLATDEAKANMGLALHLLSTTDMATDAISASLKASGAAAPAPAAAAAPASAQRQAADPLRTADPIASETPLVDTGASAAGQDGLVTDRMDDKAVVGMWNEAFGRTPIGGDVWGGLLGQSDPARAN
jgi:hypothetical protein